MPEFTDEELGLDPEEMERLDSHIRKDLRAAKTLLKERDAANARAEVAERELAFRNAGIPEDGTGALLRMAYVGELTVEAIQKKAAEYGIGTNGAAGGPTAADALAELERLRQLSASGGGPTFAPDLGANAAFIKALADNRRRAEKGEISLEQGTEEAWDIIDRLGGPAGVRRHIQ